MIGPYARNRIVLCSLDANPRSQRGEYAEAQHFFPGAKWVGTTRNAARRLGCRFVILTTGYGMVNPDDVIGPHDMHLDAYRNDVEQRWQETIPNLIGGNQYDVIVMYFGGCPRDNAIEVILPIVVPLNLTLVTFGKPNMFDSGKIDQIVESLITGTTLIELKAILRLPNRLLVLPGSNE